MEQQHIRRSRAPAERGGLVDTSWIERPPDTVEHRKGTVQPDKHPTTDGRLARVLHISTLRTLNYEGARGSKGNGKMEKASDHGSTLAGWEELMLRNFQKILTFCIVLERLVMEIFWIGYFWAKQAGVALFYLFFFTHLFLNS